MITCSNSAKRIITIQKLHCNKNKNKQITERTNGNMY